MGNLGILPNIVEAHLRIVKHFQIIFEMLALLLRESIVLIKIGNQILILLYVAFYVGTRATRQKDVLFVLKKRTKGETKLSFRPLFSVLSQMCQIRNTLLKERSMDIP